MLSFPREQLPKNPKFLIIKVRSIGDVVYNTAVYTPLKKKFPDCHLTVLVENYSLDLVRHHPDIDHVLCFDKNSGLNQLGFYFQLFANQSFLYNVKREFGDLHPKHPIDYQVALIKKMGVEFNEISSAIHISEQSKIKANELLHTEGIGDQELFCIQHPGAKIYDP